MRPNQTAGIIVALRKTNIPLDKNLLLKAIILFGALFLIVLGMRNPTLEHTHGPKQRPRAVVENNYKAPIQACSNIHFDAEICPLIIIHACSEIGTITSLAYGARPRTTFNFIPTRASPSLTSNII